jgi:hypothetical protein
VLISPATPARIHTKCSLFSPEQGARLGSCSTPRGAPQHQGAVAITARTQGTACGTAAAGYAREPTARHDLTSHRSSPTSGLQNDLHARCGRATEVSDGSITNADATFPTAQQRCGANVPARPGGHPVAADLFMSEMARGEQAHFARFAPDDVGVATPLSASRVARYERADEPAVADNRMQREWARSRYHDDDLLTVADGARLARRSVRTLRRAYLSSKLIAHRDGNGRGVTIRYGDLRAWLTAQVIVPASAPTAASATARAGRRRQVDARRKTGNSALLTAALQRRRGRARANVARGPLTADADRTP